MRNLLVHNNGVVDHAFAEEWQNVEIGDRLNLPGHVIVSAMVMLDSVKRIDSLVLDKYPGLGISAHAAGATFQNRIHQSITMLPVEEIEKALPVLAELRGKHPEIAALIPENVMFRLGTIWAVLPADDVWALVGVDGRGIFGFADEAAAHAWLDEGQLSWHECSVSEESDDVWVAGTLSNGLMFRWPRPAWEEANV
ncbi:hypothetical protein [Deinococcus aquaedulcis]|uniref:hypothetical protein n=1 Tax=Deinococcus aquaedulcis TaxID=2840455 RepID=UPI001C837D9C|nr:hypothetical protein [Deinococcus aquaedulcis]